MTDADDPGRPVPPVEPTPGADDAERPAAYVAPAATGNQTVAPVVFVIGAVLLVLGAAIGVLAWRGAAEETPAVVPTTLMEHDMDNMGDMDHGGAEHNMDDMKPGAGGEHDMGSMSRSSTTAASGSTSTSTGSTSTSPSTTR